MNDKKTVVLITGAANGIGLALSQSYLHQDCVVLMVDRDENKLEQEALNLRKHYPDQVHSQVCDVTDTDAVGNLVNWVTTGWGHLDFLYNNAGIIGELGPVWELDLHKLHQVMEVNLFGMINLIQAFCPILFAQDFRSHLINVASMYAICSGSQLSAYAMSKHAVLALSESLYFDCKRLDKPVAISVVLPSFTDTGLLSTNHAGGLQQSLQDLLARSRPAVDVAEHIVHEVARQRFYILPDKEIKAYAEERTKALILQEDPHQHSIEKLMRSLMRNW